MPIVGSCGVTTRPERASFLKEWRTELACSSKTTSSAPFHGWEPVYRRQAGIYTPNPDLTGERLLHCRADYPTLLARRRPAGRSRGPSRIWVTASIRTAPGVQRWTDGEYPAWNPMDNWIAHRGCFGSDCGLWLTHADSGERKRLTTGGGDGQPAWSPDGKRVAYISKETVNFEIYIINGDGSGKSRLTNTPQSDGLPVWSPDGTVHRLPIRTATASGPSTCHDARRCGRDEGRRSRRLSRCGSWRKWPGNRKRIWRDPRTHRITNYEGSSSPYA